MVMSRVEFPKGKTLLLTTVRWRFSISLSIFTTKPFCFSQWIRMRTSLSETLASISGSAASDDWLSEFSSHEEVSSSADSWDFLTKTTDSTVLFLVCSSSTFKRSWSCFTYLIASPRTEALSIYKQKTLGFTQWIPIKNQEEKTCSEERYIWYLLQARNNCWECYEALAKLFSSLSLSHNVILSVWRASSHWVSPLDPWIGFWCIICVPVRTICDHRRKVHISWGYRFVFRLHSVVVNIIKLLRIGRQWSWFLERKNLRGGRGRFLRNVLGGCARVPTSASFDLFCRSLTSFNRWTTKSGGVFGVEIRVRGIAFRGKWLLEVPCRQGSGYIFCGGEFS